MPTLSSDAVILTCRKHSFTGTMSDVFSACDTIDLQGRDSISNGSPSVAPHNDRQTFELRQKCEIGPVVLTPFSYSSVQLAQVAEKNVSCGFEDKQLSVVDWDKVNYETEKELIDGKDFNMDICDDNKQPTGFLDTVSALKNDTSSWTPYVSRDRFFSSNKKGCLTLLLKQCAGIFYSRFFFFLRDDFGNEDTEYLLQKDAEFALTLPFVPFDYSNFIHCKLLLAICEGLFDNTNNTNCAGVSPFAFNWEKLGFQGSDPSTDLRSTGIFGLVQLFYLIEYYREFALRLYDICTQTDSGASVYEELPFVLIGLNFSAFLLDGLKDEKLYSDIMQWAVNTYDNKEATECPYLKKDDEQMLWHELPVLSACCEYYVGCLYLFWECWARLKTQRVGKPPTISDFVVVKAKLCTKIKKNGAQFVFNACSNAKDISTVTSFNVESSTAQVMDLTNEELDC